MKLTRVVHVGGVQVFYDAATTLIPDVQLVVGGSSGEDVADRCLMFVDAAGGEAHGFLFTETQARELAEQILASRVEIFRTFPGGMLTGNGDEPT